MKFKKTTQKILIKRHCSLISMSTSVCPGILHDPLLGNPEPLNVWSQILCKWNALKTKLIILKDPWTLSNEIVEMCIDIFTIDWDRKLSDYQNLEQFYDFPKFFFVRNSFCPIFRKKPCLNPVKIWKNSWKPSREWAGKICAYLSAITWYPSKSLQMAWSDSRQCQWRD